MKNHFFLLALVFLILITIFESWPFVAGFTVCVIAHFIENYFTYTFEAGKINKRLDELESRVGKYITSKGFTDLRNKL